MSVRLDTPRPAWVERLLRISWVARVTGMSRHDWRAATLLLVSRIGTMCLVEVQKLRRDWTELAIRSIQPSLWLIIFGATFSQLRLIPTGGVPYLDYLAPGVIAQSTLLIAIFYGIQVIWERDAGILAKLMSTPTPHAALVAAKGFAAGVRGVAQAFVVMMVAVVLGVDITANPLRWLAMVVFVMLGSVFFCSLSIIIAGLAIHRDRLMGIGQAIMLPLFFASNALYPVSLMPGWLQALSKVNPLSYQVDALRGLLIGTPARYGVDLLVLLFLIAAAVGCASALLPRLAK